jgi:hypothetical protein
VGWLAGTEFLLLSFCTGRQTGLEGREVITAKKEELFISPALNSEGRI